ncbi:MAG: hypothetical protein K8U57_32265 [Planctomycetes bacterium]|nr:hypothetical protein [Planctomycetota bacterium]
MTRGSEGGIPDADLARLVVAWPTLPEHIRAAIRALVGTVAGRPVSGSRPDDNATDASLQNASHPAKK